MPFMSIIGIITIDTVIALASCMQLTMFLITADYSD